MILALALAAAQPAAATPTMPAAPPSVPAPDPARLAAAQRLLDVIHIEAQYEEILSKIIPLMTVPMFSALKTNVEAPVKLRAFLAEQQNEATATRIFTAEAGKEFRARYPQMRAATAAEYARIFTAAELTELTAFYDSPVGRKALASQAELQNRLMPLGAAAGQEAGRIAMERTLSRLSLDVEPSPRS